MKIHIKKKYYKNVRRGKAPCKFTASQPKGIGTDVYATVRVDPILKKKKLKPIKDAMIKHEVNEIKTWGKGRCKPHISANRLEPQASRVLGGTKGFWKYLKKEKI
jgi:hypothetical protein